MDISADKLHGGTPSAQPLVPFPSCPPSTGDSKYYLSPGVPEKQNRWEIQRPARGGCCTNWLGGYGSREVPPPAVCKLGDQESQWCVQWESGGLNIVGCKWCESQAEPKIQDPGAPLSQGSKSGEGPAFLFCLDPRQTGWCPRPWGGPSA